jgi:acyl carrier protein
MTDKNQVLVTITETLQTVSPGIGAVAADTALVGQTAAVDSMGFVLLLVALEQRLGGTVDLSTSFMELGDREDESNPFRTVGSLAQHIEQLVAAG